MRKSSLMLGLALLSLAAFGQSTIDFRRYQTPVKNQGDRGTCTAFGVAAALEILPGIPADISEQYLYGALKYTRKGKVKEGDFLKNYPYALKQHGFVHEEILPYDGTMMKWDDKDPNFINLLKETHLDPMDLAMTKFYSKYRLDDFQYTIYGEEEASDPQTIKHLLRSGQKAIAVSYTVHIPTWSKHEGNPERPMNPNIVVELDGKVHPYTLAKLLYLKGDLMDDLLMEEVAYGFTDMYRINDKGEKVSNFGGHVVTIVGYNERGFIIKNSWGTTWGDGGYGYVSYDLHKLLCTEALAFKEVSHVQPKGLIALSETTDLRLKSTLMGSTETGHRGKLQLSIFTTDIFSDPSISTVEYKVYSQSGRRLLSQRTVLAKLLIQDYDGFQTAVFEDKQLLDLGFIAGKKHVMVVVKVHDTKTGEHKTFQFNKVYFRTDEYKPSAY
jgi:hypothetical protein